MAFWGVEVKPTKPHYHRFDSTRGRLRVSQATLGIGTSNSKSLLQCNVGDKAPILLCALLPNQTESLTLNLEFEEEGVEVMFSVLGPRSVHLAGYYLQNPTGARAGAVDGDETDSYGEDIGDTESDFSNRTDDDYEDDFIDDTDDIQIYSPSPSPIRRSGVVIEEILDEEPENGKGRRKRLRKKYQVSDSDGDSPKRILGGSTSIFDFESEDSDESAREQEKFDKKMIKESNTRAEDGGDQVKGARKCQDSQDGMTERGVKDTNEFSLSSAEAGQEITEKPKKKKKKEKIKEGKTPEDVLSSMIDVDLQKDEAEKQEAGTDDVTLEVPISVEKHSNDKGVKDPNDSSLPSAEVGQEVTERPKKKKNKEKTEGTTPEVVVSSKSDVHKKEDKAEKQGAGTDDVTLKDPVSDEKQSNNEGNEKVNSFSLTSSEFGQETKKKRKKRAKGEITQTQEEQLVGITNIIDVTDDDATGKKKKKKKKTADKSESDNEAKKGPAVETEGRKKQKKQKRT